MPLRPGANIRSAWPLMVLCAWASGRADAGAVPGAARPGSSPHTGPTLAHADGSRTATATPENPGADPASPSREYLPHSAA